MNVEDNQEISTLRPEEDYPKQIETLVQDIYSLFETSHTPQEENLTKFANGIVDILRKRLTEDPNEVREAYLRMSSIGKKDRQLWYSMRLESDLLGGTKKTDGQTQIKFLFGDIIEHLLLFLVREAGHTVENEQLTISVDDVEGHMDCTIDGVNIDAKSASSFGMKKFKDGSIVHDDPFGYIGQLSGYKNAMERRHGRKMRQGFLVMNKENAELCLTMIPEKDTINVPQRIQHLKETIAKNTPPPRCYPTKPEDNGNIELPSACKWCAFKELCWNDANGGQGLRVFDYSNGPRFFVKVEKTPRVDEITSKYFKLGDRTNDVEL